MTTDGACLGSGSGLTAAGAAGKHRKHRSVIAYSSITTSGAKKVKNDFYFFWGGGILLERNQVTLNHLLSVTVQKATELPYLTTLLFFLNKQKKKRKEGSNTGILQRSFQRLETFR